MKITKRLFVSMASLELLLNNAVYATTENVEKQSVASTKYVFIGVAVFVIVLLLYLGYKMDTKSNENVRKKSSKSDKVKKRLAQKAEEAKQNSGTYEPDEDIPYESDEEVFKSEELNDNIEYDDNEDSLFSTAFNNENTSIFEDEVNENEFSETETDELGDEFDTSIIDDLDEDVKDENFENTMLFNSENIAKTSSGNNLEDEIDQLENINEMDNLIKEENKDTFIDELKNFKEPESDFKGFSSSSIIEDSKDEIELEDDNKKRKIVDEGNIDFLNQMEENLEKGKKGKSTKKKSDGSKKSIDKKDN